MVYLKQLCSKLPRTYFNRHTLIRGVSLLRLSRIEINNAMSTPDRTYPVTKSRAKPHRKREDKSHGFRPVLRRHHLVLWFAAACVGIAILHHRMLHWFAEVCMVAIITWVIIDLFGTVLRYKISHPLAGALDSPEFVRQLEALASSRAVANTLIEPLPNGVNFYEAEIQAIAQAQKSIDWVAYIFAKGEIAQRMVSAPCCAATILSCGSPRLALASLSSTIKCCIGLPWFAWWQSSPG
jgi:hypothetical protein